MHKVSEPLKVCIAICTLARVENLVNLLRCLDQARLTCASAEVVEILVVDNDSAGSAHGPIQQLHRSAPVPIRYVNEPSRGLTKARNRALEESTGADLLAFLDDDETVEVDWFPELVETLIQTNSQFVIGPVRPVFPAESNPVYNRSGLFHRLEFANRHVLDSGNTGNCCIDLRWLRLTGIQFRSQFNLSGGEDAAFFAEMKSAGAIGRFAARAIAYEPVERERLSAGWLIRRRMRIGANSVAQRIALERMGTLGRLLCVAVGAARVFGGLILATLVLPFSQHRALKYVAIAARGAGFIAGALGINIRGY